MLVSPPILTKLEIFSEYVRTRRGIAPLLLLSRACSVAMATPLDPAFLTIQGSLEVPPPGSPRLQWRQNFGDLVRLEISLFYFCT